MECKTTENNCCIGEDIGLLLLRVFAGGMMLFGHGLGKFMGFAEMSNTFPDPLGIGSPISLGLAVGAEFFCSILLILGIGTRYVAIPLLITMLVAAFIVHSADPFQKKELAILYAGVFLTLFFAGGGKFSVCSLFCKKCK